MEFNRHAKRRLLYCGGQVLNRRRRHESTVVSWSMLRAPKVVLAAIFEMKLFGLLVWGCLQYQTNALSAVTVASHHSQRNPLANANAHTVAEPLLEEWRDFDQLRYSKLEEEALEPFFATRPHLLVQRIWKVARTLSRAQRDWETSKNGTKLCAAVSSLGPLAVKVGQTLSQRPDIVGEEAAVELQRLQTKNLPFDNELAYAVIRESLQCQVIAPGIGEGDEKPLFASMTKDPIACASLGQVYRATTYDNRDVAIKVQRPDAMGILAIDAQCFRIVFRVREKLQSIQNLFRSGDFNENLKIEEEARGKQNIGTVIDRVARDILDEIDYRIEVANNLEFQESLAFLGFVTTPTLVDEYCTERVLVTEWIPGKHLSDLTIEQGLSMTRMAVEACTASLVLTGLVHADPHEGNIMLHDDGRVVFLDFGLMSRVDQNVMEGFARGIQACLAEDWNALTEAFADVGFVIQPIRHRSGPEDVWKVDPNFGLNELAVELAEKMLAAPGGTARFGALATVLNRDLSPRWLVFTPPYVLLLIRTFLTLEGIAAKLDPEFNIYEMAMPWAVRRSLSPSTKRGIEVFRSTFLTPDNRIQWARLLELTMKNEEEKPLEAVLQQDETRRAQQAAARDAAMNDAVGSLLGSTEGKALRRALRDLDTVDLIGRLASKDGRKLVRTAADAAAAKVVSKKSESVEAPGRPASKESREIRQKQHRWRKKVVRLLLFSHLKKQIRLRSLVNFIRVSFRFMRFSLYSVLQAVRDRIRLRRTQTQ